MLCLFADEDSINVSPSGACIAYSPPEVLQSLLLRLEGTRDKRRLYVCGPACDIWSTAVVLFQYLTGELPFLPQEPTDTIVPPPHVRKRDRSYWAHLKSMLAGQQSWVRNT